MNRLNIGIMLCVVGNIISLIGVFIIGVPVCIIGTIMSLTGIIIFGISFKECWRLFKIQDEMILRLEAKLAEMEEMAKIFF